MELLKRRWRDLSLRKTLVVYITVAALLALVLCDITNNLCSMGIREAHASYLDSMEKYYLTNERGERLGEGAYIGTDAIPLSPEDQHPRQRRYRPLGGPFPRWGCGLFQ